MYEKLAWNNFYKTGDLKSFIEYRKICELNDEFKVLDENIGEFSNEFDQGEWNSNKRGTV